MKHKTITLCAASMLFALSACTQKEESGGTESGAMLGESATASPLDDFYKGLSESDQQTLGAQISGEDVEFYDNLTFRAFEGGFLAMKYARENQFAMFPLHKEGMSKTPFGDIGVYFNRNREASGLGAPMAGEFALFDDHYRLHVFENGVLIWSRANRKIETATFKKNFRAHPES